MREDRVFVEWFDADRPGWGGYVSSLSPEFQETLVDMVARFGPPTKVEFRAHGEGWVGPEPCQDCGLDLVECKCDEDDPRTAAEHGTWEAIDSWERD